MKAETEKVLEMLQNEYGINLDKIQLSETNSDKVDYIQVDDTLYHIHKGMDDGEIAETASYIYNNLSDEFKEQQVAENVVVSTDEGDIVVDDQQAISESLKDIKVGNIYRYEPEGLDFNELEDQANFENEAELFKIAKFKPFCRVKDILIVSKEEEDGFVLVVFDIPENEDNQLSQMIDVRGKEYVVFDSDLKPIENKPEEVVTEEKEEEISEMVTETTDTPYIVKDYIVDGDEIDLVCYDTEVDEEYYKYIGVLTDKQGALINMKVLAKDTTLSIKPELYDEIIKFINNAPISGEEQPVAEDLGQPALEVPAEPIIDTPQQETSINLLTALESEKQAVLVYEALIKMATDEKEIELLNKILADEKEHIALLSSLQTTQVADFVAEDNKAELDENAQDVIDTPAMGE